MRRAWHARRMELRSIAGFFAAGSLAMSSQPPQDRVPADRRLVTLRSRSALVVPPLVAGAAGHAGAPDPARPAVKSCPLGRGQGAQLRGTRVRLTWIVVIAAVAVLQPACTSFATAGSGRPRNAGQTA